MRAWVLIVLGVGLAGCGTPSQTAVSNARPSVFVKGAAPDRIKPEVVNWMVTQKYRITKDTPYELSFDKPVENMAVQVLLGSKYDSQPNARVSYSFAPVDGGTKIFADMAVITNPGSAFERRTDVDGGHDSVAVQSLLDRIKEDLERPAGAKKK